MYGFKRTSPSRLQINSGPVSAPTWAQTDGRREGQGAGRCCRCGFGIGCPQRGRTCASLRFPARLDTTPPPPLHCKDAPFSRIPHITSRKNPGQTGLPAMSSILGVVRKQLKSHPAVSERPGRCWLARPERWHWSTAEDARPLPDLVKKKKKNIWCIITWSNLLNVISVLLCSRCGIYQLLNIVSIPNSSTLSRDVESNGREGMNELPTVFDLYN